MLIVGPRCMTNTLNTQHRSVEFSLKPINNHRLANLCGEYDNHLRLIEQRLGVEINVRGNNFHVIGAPQSIQAAQHILKTLYAETEKTHIAHEDVHLCIQGSGADMVAEELSEEILTLNLKRFSIKPRGHNQQRYVRHVLSHDINFGIGPAGTGKTYLAVACAVAALEQEKVRRIVLVRPAVEAGEHLGFLPGGLAQKVDPYLRPLYDALYEMLGFELVNKYIERNVIELAPLAYMRGRTLNDAFIILDESQNTTVEQMKMFLTRIGFNSIGFNSTTVITGDVTQVDLPKGRLSGLRHVIEVLKEVNEISFTFFKATDVVRHPLVQRIVTAYDAYENDQ
jgi:phosphate starvation-inducible protein PhoH and related proteins